MLIHINDKMAFICPQRAGHTTAWKFFGEESSNGFRGNEKISIYTSLFLLNNSY